jgi:transcriptional regulator with XRE-family HTH domain
MKNKLFEKASKSVPNYVSIFSSKSLDIVDQIHLILNRNGISQKELSKRLGKRESEISKWLSGGHNITLKTISKLEDVLNEEIIITKDKSVRAIDLSALRINLENKKLNSQLECKPPSKHQHENSYSNLIPMKR